MCIDHNKKNKNKFWLYYKTTYEKKCKKEKVKYKREQYYNKKWKDKLCLQHALMLRFFLFLMWVVKQVNKLGNILIWTGSSVSFGSTKRSEFLGHKKTNNPEIGAQGKHRTLLFLSFFYPILIFFSFILSPFVQYLSLNSILK